MRVMTEAGGPGPRLEKTCVPRARILWSLDPHFSILGFRTLYEKRREQRDGPPGRSFLLARFPCSPGNVEVGPVVLACKSGKETRRGNAARRTSTDICKVGEVAFQLFLIILPQRQPPYTVPRLRARCLQLMRQVVLVSEQPGA